MTHLVSSFWKCAVIVDIQAGCLVQADDIALVPSSNENITEICSS